MKYLKEKKDNAQFKTDFSLYHPLGNEQNFTNIGNITKTTSRQIVPKTIQIRLVVSKIKKTGKMIYGMQKRVFLKTTARLINHEENLFAHCGPPNT